MNLIQLTVNTLSNEVCYWTIPKLINGGGMLIGKRKENTSSKNIFSN